MSGDTATVLVKQKLVIVMGDVFVTTSHARDTWVKRQGQ